MRDPEKAIAALTKEQRELLQLRLKNRSQARDPGSPPSAIPRLGRDQRSFPLSPAQQRLWFLYEWDPESALYNVPACFRLVGSLEREAFRRALVDLVVRHEALRLEFRTVGGKPFQAPVAADRFRLTECDLSAHPEAEAQARLVALAREEIARPFRFPEDLPFRATLVRVNPTCHGVVLVMHHLVSDGASVAVILADLRELYGAHCSGRPPQLAALPLQYVDYAAWRAGMEGASALRAGLDFWKQSLAGAPSEIDLPNDRAAVGAAGQTQECGTEHFPLMPEVMNGLRRAMRDEGATPFMGMLALYGAYLARKSRQSEVVIGAAISGRGRVELEKLVGVFVNTLALRVDLGGNPNYRELVRRVKAVVMAAFTHQDVPFEKVVEVVSPDRHSSRSPIFQVAFGLQPVSTGTEDWAGLKLQGIPGARDSAKFEVELRIQDSPQGAVCGWYYQTGLYEASTLQRWGRELTQLAAAVAADPDRPIASHELLTEPERSEALENWNRTRLPLVSASTVPARVLDWARERPDLPALEFAGRRMTYGQWVDLAQCVAGRLTAEGVGPGVLVAVCLERSPEMVAALLGVWLAGGAYVPLDPGHPPERLRLMVRDTEAPIVISQASVSARLGDARVLLMESIVPPSAGGPAFVPRLAAASDLAYVIYTSGSTGEPKGVAIEHRGLMNLVSWHQQAYQVTERDRATQLAGLGFDASVWELWPYLSAGACVSLVEEEVRSRPESVRDWLVKERVTISFLPTPLAEVVLGLQWPESMNLRVLLTGGDRLRRWVPRDLPFEVVNHYGPTESSVVATSGRVAREGEERTTLPPIGRPIGNTTVYILDEGLLPVPLGSVGELYIGGESLARGYWRRPELTAERFIPHPFRKNERVYRTGDLVRWNAAGELEFVGRGDDQVKVRGFRIELGEIESLLARCRGIQECAVAAVGGSGESDRRLVGYVVARDGIALDLPAVRAELLERLPDYMVPVAWVTLPKLPLTRNGKLDRRALPVPEAGGAGTFAPAYVAPRSPTEEMLCGLFEALLRREKVGVHDNFFAIGGHSLLATQVVSRVRDVMRVELRVRELFERPTVAELADRLQALRGSSAPGGTQPLARQELPARLPLSFAQQRMWLLEKLGQGTYLIPSAVRLAGPLNLEALQASFNDLIRRHESLRTFFPQDDQGASQSIRPDLEIHLTAEDWSDDPDPEQRAREQARAEGERPFQLHTGPLFRVRVARLAAEDHLLMLTLHHSIADGWSMEILLRELSQLYQARLVAAEATLPELPIRYADFTLWQRQWLQGEALAAEVGYWRRQLSGVPSVLDLPLDRPRPVLSAHRGGRVSVRLGRDLSARCHQLAREEGASLFMVLLAGFQSLLGRYCRGEDIPVGTPIANRHRRELEGVVGCFVNTLVLRGDLSGNPSFRQFLQRVRNGAMDAYDHQDMPFEKLVEELAPARDSGGHPLFQVMLALQNLPPARLEPTGLQWRPQEVARAGAKFDLLLNLLESREGVVGVIEYDSELFEEATVGRLARHYVRLLELAIAAPDVELGRIELVDEAERAVLLEEYNRSFLADISPHTIPARVFAQARTQGDRVALVQGGRRMSYSELTRRARSIGNELKKLGAGRDQVVAVCLERSLEWVVGLLGVWSAGAAYAPLDPSHPEDRLRWMLDDIGTPVVLTSRALAERLGERPKLFVEEIGEAETEAGTHAETDAPGAARREDLAYVIYTSGSTGQPKGVAIEHRGLINLVSWHQQRYQVTEQDRGTQLAGLGFDASVWELWPYLSAGAAVHLIEEDTRLRPERVRDWLVEAGITLSFVPTPLAEVLLRLAWPKTLQLRAMLTGGDRLTLPAPEDLPFELINHYGPTESSVVTTSGLVRTERESGGGLPPIGRPIGNTRVYVLDAQQQLVPMGVVGELYVGGSGLARGYWQRPELTAEKFVADPWREGERLYRTGDLVKWNARGELEFVGRADDQVKIRGYRIELGEIEAALRRCDGVEECVVVVRDDGGERRLVGYVVTAQAVVDWGAIREDLKRRLPEYMVPVGWARLDALPLTPNGKVDRRALPAPDAEELGVAPQGQLEELISQVWAEVLQRRQVGRNSNFFDLGGHSLLLVQAHSKLEARLGRSLRVVDLFRFPTVAGLAAHLGGATPRSETPVERPTREEPIAIIGLAGRFPGARDLREFWDNLTHGKDCIRFFTPEELEQAGLPAGLVRHPSYVRAKGVLEDAEYLDAAFFGLTPREAEAMDPQHRIFLECAWEALENAGCNPAASGIRTGVFGGVSQNTYLANLLSDPELVAALGGFQVMISTDKDFLATRVSYKLNLQGPSVAVQTACSTSLVAVHLACQSLRLGECDVALAGGASVSLPLLAGYTYVEDGVVSPDGHCRAFDASAQGCVRGNGVGMVALKRLSEAKRDGDLIHAVILGSAINNDGSAKVGYTAPSVEGQAEVIRRAHALAGVDPVTISYLEAHGTGTRLGDPIEIAALTEAFGRGKTGNCRIGTLKTNVGHLDAAAGVAGLIKTVLSLEHAQVVPSLHYQRANPEIDFEGSPFVVNTALTPWTTEGQPRRAGVSSFGIGGTNAHVVIEEAPVREASPAGSGLELFVLSARSEEALEAGQRRLQAHLERAGEKPALWDVAWTLQTGRKHFELRKARVVETAEQAIEALGLGEGWQTGSADAAAPRVMLLFSGQGSQRAGMGRELYEHEAVFRKWIDAGSEKLQPLLGADLRELLYPGDPAAPGLDRLDRTEWAQPALFVVEYALCQLWKSWGLRADGMLGHSLGEYVAATEAGVMTFEEALEVVAIRGRLMQRMESGAMLAVMLGREELAAKIRDHEVELAAYNGPRQTVVSGTPSAIERLAQALKDQGVGCKELATSHAFHSRMMEPMMAEFLSVMKRVKLRSPTQRYFSNLSGRWVRAEEVVRAEYWVEHLRRPVEFAAAIQELKAETGWIFVEVGPGRSLVQLTQQTDPEARCVASLWREGRREVMAAAGQLWCWGVDLNWAGLHAGRRRVKVALPTYAFQRQKFWVDRKPMAAQANSRLNPMAKRPDPADWLYRPVWRSSPTRPRKADSTAPGLPTRFLVIEDDAGVSARLGDVISAAGSDLIRVRLAERYERLGSDSFTVGRASLPDLESVFRQLREESRLPERVLHVASVCGAASPNPATDLDGIVDRCFFSLLNVARAWDSSAGGLPLTLAIITNNACEIGSGMGCQAQQLLAAGPARVIPLEFPRIRCGMLDFDWTEFAGASEQRVLSWIVEQSDLRRGEPLVALRGVHCWGRSYEPFVPTEGEDAGFSLAPGLVCLITGGLSGIGLEIAEALATQAPMKLALLSRSEFPAPADWGAWLESHPAEDGTSVRIRRLQDLQRRGTEVRLLRADVSDVGQLAAVVAEVETAWGPIRGVVHSAGVAGGGLMQLRSREACLEVLRPKLQGTWALEAVLAGRALDFFVLCSSLSSVLGALGQVDYCAANAFLDGFAHAGGGGRVSINWDTWAEVGMAVRTDLPAAWEAHRAEQLRQGIRPAEGRQAFWRALSSGLPQVLVSTRDLKARLAARPPASTPSAATTEPGQSASPAVLSPIGGEDLEAILKEIWRKVLGISDCGMQDNFFDLGGNSLSAVQVVALVKQKLSCELQAVALYDCPTIHLLAKKLRGADASTHSREQSEERADTRRERMSRRRQLREPKSQSHSGSDAAGRDR